MPREKTTTSAIASNPIRTNGAGLAPGSVRYQLFSLAILWGCHSLIQR